LSQHRFGALCPCISPRATRSPASRYLNLEMSSPPSALPSRVTLLRTGSPCWTTPKTRGVGVNSLRAPHFSNPEDKHFASFKPNRLGMLTELVGLTHLYERSPPSLMPQKYSMLLPYPKALAFIKRNFFTKATGLSGTTSARALGPMKAVLSSLHRCFSAQTTALSKTRTTMYSACVLILILFNATTCFGHGIGTVLPRV